MKNYTVYDGVAEKDVYEGSSIDDAQRKFESLKRYYDADSYQAERSRLLEKGWRESTLDKYTVEVVLVGEIRVNNNVYSGIDSFSVWCADVQRRQATSGSEKAHLINSLNGLNS